MTAVLFAMLASVSAVGYEILTKQRPDASWFELLLPWGILCTLCTQYGIYRILHSGETLIGGLVLFSVCTAVLRTSYTLVVGHEVSPVAWIAFGLVFTAGLLKLAWA